MNICKVDLPEATTLQKAAQTEDNSKPPLLPSEKNAIPAIRKPRSVASRYKSGISSTPVSTPSTPRRSPSPNASHTSPAPGMSLPKRSQSAERRSTATASLRLSAPSSPSRPSTLSSPSSRSTTPVRDMVMEGQSTTRRLPSNRAPDGLWPSMRSLSSSIQSESPVVPVSKREKLVASSSSDKTIKSPAKGGPERKRTPLRGRNTSDHSENSKPLENLNAKGIDQHQWPGLRGGKLCANPSSRSVDLADNSSRSASLTVASQGVSPKRTNPSSNGATRVSQLSLNEVAERMLNDGGGRVKQDLKSVVNSSSETSVRSSSMTQPSSTQSPSSPSNVLSTSASTARGMLSSSRTRPSSSQSLSIPGLHRPLSPIKILSTSSSTTRGMLSPSRTRLSTPISSSCNVTSRAGCASSVLNYNVDVRKGKKNASHIEDAYQLRLLHNANLQWRFVNAQAEKTLSIQKLRTENVLHGVWNSMSNLRDSVIMKRIDVQHLQQVMKLNMILKEQMAYLEQWIALERDHYGSLSRAVEALSASTLRLPVTGGAKADAIDVKNAVSSAVDVMQAMGSSICHLLYKVGGTKSLVSELSAVAAKEKFMLDECRDLLASTAAMQVQESSLRTHIMQLRQDARELT